MENQPRMTHPFREHGEDEIPQVPLSSLPTGKTGCICQLEGGHEFMARVACLGFTIGAQVTVLQNFGWGPMIVSLLGAHIALGRGEAWRIQVQPL